MLGWLLNPLLRIALTVLNAPGRNAMIMAGAALCVTIYMVIAKRWSWSEAANCITFSGATGFVGYSVSGFQRQYDAWNTNVRPTCNEASDSFTVVSTHCSPAPHYSHFLLGGFIVVLIGFVQVVIAMWHTREQSLPFTVQLGVIIQMSLCVSYPIMLQVVALQSWIVQNMSHRVFDTAVPSILQVAAIFAVIEGGFSYRDMRRDEQEQAVAIAAYGSSQLLDGPKVAE